MLFFSRRNSRRIRYSLLAFALLLAFDLLFSSQRTKPSFQRISSARDLKDLQSVYIASTQWNSGSLLQEHWIPNLLQVVKDLQAANIRVHVSIYENGSWDSTKSLLQQLRQDLDVLGVQNTIMLDEKSHESIIAHNSSFAGYIQTAYGPEMRRIPYLANVRNEALKPLHGLIDGGETFDRLLYINDVIFSVCHLLHPTRSVTNLLISYGYSRQTSTRSLRPI